MEIRVVLPQPDGPTSISNSPVRTSRSSWRRACTAAGPSPYVLRKLSHFTATLLFVPVIIKSASENNRWFKANNLQHADEGRADTDQHHRAGAQDQKLPRQLE